MVHPEPTPNRNAPRRARKTLWRRRGLQGIAASAAIGVIGAGLLADHAWNLAASPSCDQWQPVDLTLQDVVAVKKRHDAYRANPEAGSLALFGEELTFLLQAEVEYSVWLGFEGDQFQARVAVPHNGVCYNIEAEGTLQAERHLATVQFDALTVGELDLSRWVGDAQIEVDAADLESMGQSELARHLRRTSELSIEGDQLLVQVDRGWDLW